MTDTVKEQILEIRGTAETNMFDWKTVQAIANRRGFYELVIYLEEHRREYTNFILTGNATMHEQRTFPHIFPEEQGLH